ncbi:serine/threonine protein kinase [Microbacterium lacticum]
MATHLQSSQAPLRSRSRTHQQTQQPPWTSQLTDAAASIWAQGTAHRDLSPNNIILDADGRPVIVDLGLARHVDDESYTALPTPGMPGWMSPEQVGSSPVHGDWRSDQFVIGALAYRLLTNVQPFYALSLIDRWRAPAVQTPQPIRAIDPEIPSAVADVVERMLHKQPHRRYLKVSELLTDLTLAISSMQSASTIETSPQRFLLNIGQVKNYAENGFLSALRPHGVVIDIRAGSRVREFVDAAHDVGAEAIVESTCPGNRCTDWRRKHRSGFASTCSPRS